jgi:hypothetical protein
MKLAVLMTLSVLFVPGLVKAAGFDGSSPLFCAARIAMECTEIAGCERLSPNSGDVPSFIDIDFEAKIIRDRANPQSKRTSKIEHMKQIDGKLLLQGAEDGAEGVRDGVAWSIAIQVDNGRMAMTASGDDVGFVVFVACVHR